MAASLRLAPSSLLAPLFPALTSAYAPVTHGMRASSFTARIAAAVLVPSSPVWSIPSLLSGLWDSVLRAAPKKKTSLSKRRSRQLAGKALKDRIDINKCPACGEPKRAHLLCPSCVKGES